MRPSCSTADNLSYKSSTHRFLPQISTRIFSLPWLYPNHFPIPRLFEVKTVQSEMQNSRHHTKIRQYNVKAFSTVQSRPALHNRIPDRSKLTATLLRCNKSHQGRCNCFFKHMTYISLWLWTCDACLQAIGGHLAKTEMRAIVMCHRQKNWTKEELWN